MHLPTVAADRLLLVKFSGDDHKELTTQLLDFGYDVHGVDSIDGAFRKLTAEPVFPTVLIAASCYGGRMRDAYADLVKSIVTIRRASGDSQIVMTVDASIDISVCCEAINNGLAGFVEVDGGRVDADVLRRRLDYARQRYERTRNEARRLHSGEVFEGTGIVGSSRAMAMLLSQTARAAEVSDAPVLIYGESGTGKQLVAETIHRLDPARSGHPFLSVNCAAITGTLAESALFGHVKGAFTGATEPRSGYFRAADGGTVFLDEIGELSLELQPKLLRFLQEGMVMPVGSDTEHPVDVRIVAAANRRIPALVEAGRFRLDLYQRLNVITLEVPPLRERRDDIPLLVDFFVKKYAAHYGKPVMQVNGRVYELLVRSTLDGNVRELENMIRRSLAMKADGDELTLRDMPATLLKGQTSTSRRHNEVLTKEVVEDACSAIKSGAMTLPRFIEECERLVLAQSIDQRNENHADLSRTLGLSSRTLYNKRRKYRL